MKSRAAIYVLAALLVVLEGGLLAGWLPWGSAPYLYAGFLLIAGWRLEYDRFAVLAITGAVLIDGLRAAGDFGLSQLSGLLVAAIVLARLRGIEPSVWQTRLLLLLWVSVRTGWAAFRLGAALPPGVWLVLTAAAAVEIGFWWWLIRQLSRMSYPAQSDRSRLA